jgi:hypothetical protein
LLTPALDAGIAIAGHPDAFGALAADSPALPPMDSPDPHSIGAVSVVLADDRGRESPGLALVMTARTVAAPGGRAGTGGEDRRAGAVFREQCDHAGPVRYGVHPLPVVAGGATTPTTPSPSLTEVKP